MQDLVIIVVFIAIVALIVSKLRKLQPIESSDEKTIVVSAENSQEDESHTATDYSPKTPHAHNPWNSWDNCYSRNSWKNNNYREE